MLYQGDRLRRGLGAEQDRYPFPETITAAVDHRGLDKGAGGQLDAGLTASRRRTAPRPIATRFNGGTLKPGYSRRRAPLPISG
jgi:hypothetical protein